MIADLPHPIGIVCHDAGGANQIIAQLRNAPPCDVRAYVAGPAAALWRAAFPQMALASDLDSVIRDAASVISGTGWASDLEHRARVMAASKGIPSIAMLDHWANYAMRFERGSTIQLPDRIWVADAAAYRIALATFDAVPIERVTDHYMQGEVAQIAPVPKATQGDPNTDPNAGPSAGPHSDPAEILYLFEPARDTWGRGDPGEFQAFEYFMAALPGLGIPETAPLVLRAHPSDPPGKYDHFLCQCSPRAVRLDTGPLYAAISRARWVAGMGTFAMAIALNAGRSVYTSLPPWAPRCALPHSGIITLRDLARDLVPDQGGPAA